MPEAIPDSNGKRLIKLFEQARDITNFIYTIFSERSNLYGALIMLMLDSGKWEFTFDKIDFDTSREYMLFIDTVEMDEDENIRKLNFTLKKRDDI